MTRALASPVATAALLAVTVLIAGALSVAAVQTADTVESPRQVALSATADASGTVTLEHEGGPALDVRELQVRVSVDGTALARQPPVPFFAASGFASGPTGPFNPAASPTWTVGETASFQVAGTNEPSLAGAEHVTVRLYRRGTPVARVTVDVQ